MPLETSTGDSQAELILGDMTEVLASGVPGEARDREEILPELIRAGFYSPRALAEYRAIRTVLVFTPLFAAVGTALLVPPSYIPYVALGGLVLAALGFSLPRLYVYLKGKARSREIERGLPVFADMLSIALLAGQGLLGALRRVTDQLRNTFPQMAQELDIVVRQAELLNLNVAFEQWANRSQMEEVRNLSLMLNQCQKMGNDVTDALMEFATHLRQTSRQRADARAQRASFWMLFPTILFLWIPAAVLIVAPIGFEFQARRQKAREALPKLDMNDPNIQRHFQKNTLKNLAQ
ncbi:MAG: type II secretion system F family protein [Gemmataceae bacterium]|nr:type II secretion system F family protein [Gemmataceae bacterium]MDW8243470.1 type II secretion system F family protein [Thermogemmata sp.]